MSKMGRLSSRRTDTGPHGGDPVSGDNARRPCRTICASGEEFGVDKLRDCSRSRPVQRALTLRWLALIAAGLLAAGAAAGDSRDDAPLRIHGVNYLGDLPTLIADENGLFREHNLDITVARATSGSNNIEALRTGDTDLALMALTPFVLERLRTPDTAGPDVPVILASLVHSTRLNDVVVAADGEIGAPRDLAGRRVGFDHGTNSEYLWWLFTILHGLDPDAVTLVDYPVAELGRALTTDAIDAAVIWEPWTTLAADAMPSGLERLPGGDIYTEKWVLVATQRLVRERPQAIRDLLASYHTAIEWIDAYPEQAFARFAATAGISEGTAQGKIDQVLFGLSLDWSLIAELQQHVDWARATGQDVGVTDTDLLAWIAAEPLRATLPAAVSIPRRADGGDQP